MKLLATGTDRTPRTRDDKTAATLARENGHAAVAEMLEAL